MALQTSGQISLTDIQTEFGGTNPISITEYYSNTALVPARTSATNGDIPSSGQISISSFYGSSSPDIETVTIGSVFNTFKGEFYLAQGYNGFNELGTGAFGSISNGTFKFLSDATIRTLAWETPDSGGTGYVYFSVTGSYSNSGWKYMKTNGFEFERADADFNDNGTRTRWRWTMSDGLSPIFGNEGTNQEVMFVK
jgi:hypothetical protein